MGRGLVLALAGPAAIALLFATVVGLPIAVIGFAALCLLYAMAFAAIAFAMGLYVRRVFGRKTETRSRWQSTIWTAIGAFVLVVVGLIPIVGWVFWVLAITAGLGAVVAQLGGVFARPAAS